MVPAWILEPCLETAEKYDVCMCIEIHAGLGFGVPKTEELPKVNTEYRNYFENYVRAYNGEEEFLVQIPQVCRGLRLMDAVRESGRTENQLILKLKMI